MPGLSECKHILISTVRVYAKRYTRISLHAAERRFGSREGRCIRDALKEMHIKTVKAPALKW